MRIILCIIFILIYNFVYSQNIFVEKNHIKADFILLTKKSFYSSNGKLRKVKNYWANDRIKRLLTKNVLRIKRSYAFRI